MHDRIAIAAQEFLDAFHILSESNQRAWREILKSNPYSISPSAMRRIKSGELKRTSLPDYTCLAFSLELFLKSLLSKHQQIGPKSHKLTYLFGKLPAAIQDSVIARTGGRMGATMGRVKFLSRLEKISDAFEEWRYIYEKGHASFLPDFGVALALALRDEVAS